MLMQLFEVFSSQIFLFFLLVHPEPAGSVWVVLLLVLLHTISLKKVDSSEGKNFFFYHDDFSVMIERRPAEIPPFKSCTVMYIGTPVTAEIMHMWNHTNNDAVLIVSFCIYLPHSGSLAQGVESLKWT